MSYNNVSESKIVKSKWYFFTVTNVLIFVLDQYSKELAIKLLKFKPTYTYLMDTFRLQYAENKGAFLSLGADANDIFRFWVLGVLVGVLLSAYTFYTIKISKDSLSIVSISLIAAGGYSNIFDRIFRDHGSVIDFMNMGIGSLRTGIFNIADMTIVLGFLLIAYQAILQSRQKSALNKKVDN